MHSRDPAMCPRTGGRCTACTGAAVSALVLAILMISLQRFWRADLTAGASKG
ncbi:hypothetical protein [Microbacterium sp. G2-8]|uniref:hypothetical protein n=1 Tax=Microbacterium sp. G2-8 TaxID=2842454 RepID=UPI001C8A4199|nr:hypothetical protein [Microbacterium sp. G2-8]